MLRSRSLLCAALVCLTAAPALAHGGRFRGPRGGVPPGLPSQPSAPGQSGGSFHSWLTWWGYNQFKYMDFRKRQAARRGPVSGKDPKKKEDPNAWRIDVRTRLTPLMLEALRDDDEEVRTAACVALGKWQIKLAIPDLTRVYEKDDKRQVRESAVLGLILMRDPAVRDQLIKIIESFKQKQGKQESLRVKGFALLGLGLLGDEESRNYLVGLLEPSSKHAKRFVPKKSKERREFLCAAVAALTQVDDFDMGPDFLRIAQDKRQEDEVRGYAVSSLGKIKSKAHLLAVAEMLTKAKSEHIRRSAALALGSLAGREHTDVIKLLEKRLKRDKDRITKHFCILSLGLIGGPTSFRILTQNYSDATKEERGFYLMAAGLTKSKYAGGFLAKEAKTLKDPMEAAAAALALGILDDEKFGGAVNEVFAGAKAWTLKQTCMLSLGILNHQPAAETVKGILIKERQASVRTSAALSYALLRQWSAIPVFTDLLRSAKSIVTLSAISQVMGFLSSPRAVNPLVELYKDKNLQRQARAFAIVALGALGDSAEFPILVRLAFDINYMIRSDPVDEAVTIL